jgi:hypothetical protein
MTCAPSLPFPLQQFTSPPFIVATGTIAFTFGGRSVQSASPSALPSLARRCAQREHEHTIFRSHAHAHAHGARSAICPRIKPRTLFDCSWPPQYLHESRHKHALNRARGTAGRFVPQAGNEEGDEQTAQDDKNGVSGPTDAYISLESLADTIFSAASASAASMSMPANVSLPIATAPAHGNPP